LRRGWSFSAIVTAVSVFLILALNVFLFYLKLWLMGSTVPFLSTNASTIYNMTLSFSITTAEFLYKKLARYLTDQEFHLTDTGHMDSMIFKLFCVEFINSYASLYYTAFAEKHLEGDCVGYITCTDELHYMLLTILGGRVMFTWLYDNFLPRVYSGYRYCAETQGVKTEPSDAEKQFMLDKSRDEMELMTRFMDQVILFGYMVLFVAAFPMAPLVGFVSNIFQLHQYGNKLLYHTQRNMPHGVHDIGTFQLCFEFQATAAVITNSALVYFTMSAVHFPDDNYVLVVWAFFGTVLVILKGFEIVKIIIPNRFAKVKLQLQRQEFFQKKIMRLSPDEPEALKSYQNSFSFMRLSPENSEALKSYQNSYQWENDI